VLKIVDLQQVCVTLQEVCATAVSVVITRDVPDSGWPVLPAGNCITSE